jgi:hypothetical protein
MSPAPNALPDSTTTSEAPQRRPRLYTPGLSDALGDRLLTFDNSTASSLELLRFKKEFSDVPGFEAALRKRIDDFSRLRHPGVAAVRTTEWLGEGEGLALVSNHTAGRRLSEIIRDARGVPFALELVRQVAPALVALQQQGQGLAHGVLTPERIVVTREGRLVVVEHVLGAAVELLGLSPDRLKADLGLAVPAGTEPAMFNSRCDVIQLGLIALSLLLGRRLDPAEFPASVPSILDEFTHADAVAAARFRPWLERALQVGERPFASAQEAYDAFMKLPEDTVATPAAAPRAKDAAPAPVAARPAASKVAAPVKKSEPAPEVAVVGPSQWRSSRTFKVVRWAVAGLVVLAIGEGLVIAGLFSRPASVVVAPPPPQRAELLPTQPPTVIQLPAVTPATTPDPAQAAAQKPATPDAAAPAKSDAAPADRPVAASSKFGGIKLTSPIDLQVFENGTVVGSTTGPIAVNEGSHVLDLVNEELGFRFRQTVSVKAGQMTALKVGIPNGRVSINAVPWAEVTIDGNPAGQTPIANFSLPIGTHEIVFRHPQLGEQRQSVVVKTEGLTRVSAVLQK